MRLWKKSPGVSPSTSPSSCHSHSVQRNNSGSDNGTNFVGNKHCGLEDIGSRDRGEYIRREVNILSLTNHDISSMSSVCYLVHNELDKINQKQQFILNLIFKIVDILLFMNVQSKSVIMHHVYLHIWYHAESIFNCIIYNDLCMYVCMFLCSHLESSQLTSWKKLGRFFSAAV